MVVCVLDFIWILTTLDNFTTGHSHSHDHDHPSLGHHDDRHSSKHLDDDLLTINHSHHRHHLTVPSVHATIAQPLFASPYPYKQLNAVTKSYHTIDPPTTSAIGSGGAASSSSSSGSSASSSSQLVNPSMSSSRRSNTPSPPPTNGNDIIIINNNTINNNTSNKTVHIPGRIAPAHGPAPGQGLDIQSIGNDLDVDDESGGEEGMGCGSGTLRLPSLPPTLSYDPLVTFTTVAQLFGEGHMGNETVPYLATG